MERNNIEPKRGVSALVEALRIRALTLTGQSWERAGTIAMMKDAADMLEQLTADICEHLAASPRVGAPICAWCFHPKSAHGKPSLHSGNVCEGCAIEHVVCLSFRVGAEPSQTKTETK
jgi:hypothetical protein